MFKIEGYAKPTDLASALKFLFDHQASLGVTERGGGEPGTPIIDIGEFWVELQPDLTDFVEKTASIWTTVYVLCDHGNMPDDCEDCANDHSAGLSD